ncbi:hypothetical protein Mal4_45230 [Maioricimonas rarisocia]|uniref:HEAT repeat protein n=1 Tax=Maioricimonas rarisocia TaxID=2528026 RepID=A0A517ZCF8_9PLAN|nr:HEAT repeat domain-containing protein [Maioricimonas rarisocia]QDU40168.1 hypothetical protein Mal4_45230 [Maioricimonas rarisocia]
MSAWQKLGDDLLALDQWGDFDAARTKFVKSDPSTWKWRTIDPHPVNIVVNAGVPREHFDAFVPRLLVALDELRSDPGLEMVVRSLTKKKLTVATEKLIQLFEDESLVSEHRLLWAVGNAVYTIEPRDHLDRCLHICRNPRLGDSRQRLIVHLCRFKKSEEVFETLISLLDEDNARIRGAAFEALKRLDDVRALAAIERTPVGEGDDSIYERHQKQMALKKLNEKKARSSR